MTGKVVGTGRTAPDSPVHFDAIAYYLANRADVDEYLRGQDEVWKQGREKANAARSPVLELMRGLAAETETNAQ